MTDLQHRLLSALRDAAAGNLRHGTRGQIHAVEDAITQASDADLRIAAAKLLEAELEAVLAERRKPPHRRNGAP